MTSLRRMGTARSERGEWLRRTIDANQISHQLWPWQPRLDIRMPRLRGRQTMLIAQFMDRVQTATSNVSLARVGYDKREQHLARLRQLNVPRSIAMNLQVGTEQPLLCSRPTRQVSAGLGRKVIPIAN